MRKPTYITKTLWNKLNPDQQVVFCKAYDLSLEQLNMLSEIHNEAKAHNIAWIVATKLGDKGV